MNTILIQQFAELGRVALDFAETITDPSVLDGLLDLLSEEAGDIDRVYGVTLDGKTFSGKADQRYGLAKVQTYRFSISPTKIEYQILNAAEMAEYAESEQGWADIVEFATKAGKKLNCKPGNVQCGGKCQSGKFRCTKNPSPGQTERVKELMAKATPKAKSKTKESEAKTESLKQVQKQPSLKLLTSGVKKQLSDQWGNVISTPEMNDLINKVAKWERDGKPPTTEQERRVADNATISQRMQSLATTRNLRGLEDEQGNLQATALVAKKKGELYLEYLSTAPWNVSADDNPRKTKGAGTRMLYELAKEAVASKSKISLESLEGAKTFYEKIGFKQTGTHFLSGLPEMSLSVSAAKEFIAKMEASA